MYVNQLPTTIQLKVKQRLYGQGQTNEDIELAMTSKLDDLADIIDVHAIRLDLAESQKPLSQQILEMMTGCMIRPVDFVDNDDERWQPAAPNSIQEAVYELVMDWQLDNKPERPEEVASLFADRISNQVFELASDLVSFDEKDDPLYI